MVIPTASVLIAASTLGIIIWKVLSKTKNAIPSPNVENGLQGGNLNQNNINDLNNNKCEVYNRKNVKDSTNRSIISQNKLISKKGNGKFKRRKSKS